MFTTIPDNRQPKQRRLMVDGEFDEAVLVGPAMRGWIYRSCSQTCYYRLIPLDTVSLSWRQRLHDQLEMMRGREANGALGTSVLLFDWNGQLSSQSPDDEGPSILLRYPATATSVPLVERFINSPPRIRLRAVLSMLQAIENWWRHVTTPRFPMPAEVILDDTESASLLWLPGGEWPSELQMIEAAERGRYVAPEILRSTTGIGWDEEDRRRADLYSLGVCLLSAFFNLAPVQRLEAVLFQAANGRIHKNISPRSDLPRWFDQFRIYRQTTTLVQCLISPVPERRSQYSLTEIGDRVRNLIDIIDPYQAAVRLHDQAEPQEALRLLEGLFPVVHETEVTAEERYNLLVLAGDLCAGLLARPLDAIDYYGQSIDLDRSRLEGRLQQLKLIAKAQFHPQLESLIKSSRTIADDLDEKIWTNYHVLKNAASQIGEERARSCTVELVQYLLWREQYDKARDLAYRRLFDDIDGQQVYRWWDLELNLLYTRSYVELAKSAQQAGQLETARSNLENGWAQLTVVKDSFLRCQQQGLLVHPLPSFQDEMDRLEMELVSLRQALDASSTTRGAEQSALVEDGNRTPQSGEAPIRQSPLSEVQTSEVQTDTSAPVDAHSQRTQNNHRNDEKPQSASIQNEAENTEENENPNSSTPKEAG